ncbi:nucleotidyltransferase family protein [Roseovarius amoyensis]|uniref:nucleotidyltransferase family protein n=1 Tax=Roseovarius amoyensis TaxID=2211448 RepID=UPI000DBE8337|nr:nucleotidyltransferase family protein [Roseovarius amoyensis]
MNSVAILIPAAGRSARMRGRDKLLEPVEGVPLLRRQADIARRTGAPVMVTLPPAHAARLAVLAGLDGVRITPLPEAPEGIAASIRAGAGWAREIGAQGLMVLLADLPEIGTDDLHAMMRGFAAAPGTPLRATDASGLPGHPVILPARLYPALAGLSGDRGAGVLLKRERPAEIALPGRRATTDLDTPEDWAAWRARGQEDDEA